MHVFKIIYSHVKKVFILFISRLMLDFAQHITQGVLMIEGLFKLFVTTNTTLRFSKKHTLVLWKNLSRGSIHRCFVIIFQVYILVN